MTKEDKELLLKDLCARLPYGVKMINTEPYSAEHNPILTLSHISEDNAIGCRVGKGFMTTSLGYIKPYLFPLSSLTEEQRNDISKLLIDTQKKFSPYGKLNFGGCDNLFISTAKQANVFINYCLIHHLDINGFIEKGLAIDATGLNIY